jgi:hypothetical protein
MKVSRQVYGGMSNLHAQSVARNRASFCEKHPASAENPAVDGRGTIEKNEGS